MVFRMKTTLILPDHLVRALKQRALEQGTTLSAVVAEALRRGLEEPAATEIPPLPVYHMGRPRVDLSDRDALHAVMEGP